MRLAGSSSPAADNAAMLEGFLAALAVRGSPQTLARYARAVRSLLDVIGERSLTDLTRRDLQRALAELHARGLGPRTLAVTLSAWRSLFRHLARAGHVVSLAAFEGLRAPRAPRRLPDALHESEAVRLVEPDPQGEVGQQLPMLRKRDQAILELLYGCGLRIGELVALDMQQLDLEGASLRVFGKGRKERLLPIGAPALAALRAWLAVRPVTSNPALFLGVRGERIAAGMVRRALKKRALERGIDSRMYPHRLRHSFASHLLQSSGDLRAVQELMGHASIASTQVYTHLDFAHLAKAYDAAHPRAQRKKR